jgi:hypothetical protein
MTKETKPAVIPIYQRVENIPVREITVAEGNRDNTVVPIYLFSDTGLVDSAVVADKLRAELLSRFWWLMSEWKDKGLPREQLSVSSDRLKIEVFNFGEVMDDQEVEDFKSMVSIYSQLRGEMEYTTILISDIRSKNDYTGEALNGQGYPDARMIKIDPHTREKKPHRIYEVGNFLGTLIHEGAHPYVSGDHDVRIINSWAKEFGWHLSNNAVLTPGGFPQSQFVDEPDRTISDYAKFNPDEDLCESVVAALFASARLDRGRFNFLDRELGVSGVQMGNNDSICVARRSKNQIILPRSGEVAYCVKIMKPITRAQP